MVQTASIIGTAARENLPSARLDARRADAGDFGGQLGQGLSALGDAVSNRQDAITAFQVAKERDDRQLQDFNNQADFLDFSSQEQARLDEAKRAATNGAPDFTKNFMTDYSTNAQKWIADRNLTGEQRAKWAVQMAQLHSSVAGEALRSEFALRDQHYNATIAVKQDELKTGIAQTPAAVDGYIAQGDAVIAASGLSEADKEVKRLAWRQDAAQAYGLALTQRDPAAAIKALGGPVTEAGDFTGDGAKSTTEKTAFTTFRTGGLSGVAAAALVGSFVRESNLNTGAVNKGDGRDGSDSVGLAQWNSDRKAALAVFAKTRGKPISDLDTQLAFVQHELETSETPAARQLRSAATVEDAVAAASSYLRPKGWTPGGDPTKVDGYKERLAAAKRIAGSAATQTTAPAGQVDPHLAALPFDARMSLYGTATRQREQQILVADKDAQERHNTWWNQFQLDLQDGKAGVQDIEVARAKGQLTDASDVAQANNIISTRVKKQADLTFFNNAMASPGFTWNPFDKDQKDALDAGVKALGGTPQAALNIFQRAGVLPPSGGVVIRGALVSTNAEQVTAAAMVASNMMARNPNVFAGMDGSSDMEAAATTFDHYVNGLGYSAEEAGRRVAQMNDPSYREKMKVADPQIQDFRKVLRKQDHTRDILKAVKAPSHTDFGMGADQRQAILQDYSDLAADHYARFGDPGAAQDFASKQMARLYGVSNGVLTKYPPERVYPPVNGKIDYVYQQAAGDIKALTGRTVKTDQIYLMPIPTMTAEAWRSGQQTPYQIHYVDEVDGQKVYRVLWGKGFVADPKKPLAEQTAANQKMFERGRRISQIQTEQWAGENPGAGAPGSMIEGIR